MVEIEKYKGIWQLWDYIPSMPLAIVFAILFGIITSLHMYKMIKTKMWFCIPFVIGGICEPIGYTTRALSTPHPSSLTLYLLQALFILLPPVLFSATLYMTYSRLVRSVRRPSLSPISPLWCTRLFVAGDVICLAIQATGGGLTASMAPSTIKAGDHIVVAGLGMQIGMFVSFVGCCVVFHMRLSSTLHTERTVLHTPWSAMLTMLYFCSVTISARNVFRLVEYVMGKGSYLFAREWPTYVCDGALMLGVMGCFYVWYPDQLVVGKGEERVEEERLGEEGSVGEQGERSREKGQRYFGMGRW